MRHLGSLVAGLVVTPLAWVLLAYGQGHTYPNWNDSPSHNYFWYEPVLFLAAAGLLVGLLSSTRISPVGPVVAGATYLAVGVAALAVQDVYKLVPKGFTISLSGVDRQFALRLPIDNGSAVVLGAVMLVAVFSVGRWRAWPRAAAVPAPGTGEPSGEPEASAEPSAGSEELTAPQWPTPTDESNHASDDYSPTLTKGDPSPSGSPWAVPPTRGANQD